MSVIPTVHTGNKDEAPLWSHGKEGEKLAGPSRPSPSTSISQAGRLRPGLGKVEASRSGHPAGTQLSHKPTQRSTCLNY